MSNVKKTLQMTSLLFGMALLFCFIAWHLGYDGFILIGSITIPYWLNTCLCVLLFSINYIFMTSFILEEYSLKAIRYALPFIALYAISAIFFPSFIMSGPISTLYLIAIGVYQKKFKKTIIRAGISSAVIIAYQFLAISLKTGQISSSYSVSIYVMLMFSIDMIIFSILLWAIGGVKYERERSLELVVFPGRTRDDRNSDESYHVDSQDSEDIRIILFEKWVMRSVIMVVQVIQWMLILFVCSLDNLFIDGLVMTTSFICYGMVISKRKHYKPVVLCTVLATIMFYISAKFTFSFQQSNFFPIIMGLILVYTLYRISYHFDKVAERKATDELQRIEKLERDIDKAWDYIDKLS